MKTIGFLITGLLLSIRVLSQDSLYTKEGQVIAGKVIEINNEDIKYKKNSNLDGPTYIVSKSNIVMIEYKNGTKDVFAKTTSNTTSNSNQNYSNNNYPTQTQVYVNQPRPALNVIVRPNTFYRYNSWGWGYRPNINIGGGYGNHGWHGGAYVGHHGGYGHHR